MALHATIKARMLSTKWEAEEFVRHQTKVRHTIIRPGALSEGEPSKRAFTLSQRDATLFGWRPIAKADVGRLAVAAALDPASDCVTFEVMGGADAGVPVTLDVFGGLKKDGV